MRKPRAAAIALICLLAGPAATEPVSLLPDGAFGAAHASLVPGLSAAQPAAFGGGLLAGRDARGAFFEDGQGWTGEEASNTRLRPGPAVARLRDLIASAEAGPAGYDAVQHAARIKPPRRPTQMTIAEIYAWIDATPGQHHAIGRYQFIPPTLRRLVALLDIDPRTRFSPRIQDQLADRLLQEAGLQDFTDGDLSRTTFKRNLARIWAGLPLPSGRSYYDGYAGNKATMSWQRFETAMLQIFPR
jgi:hypothetical protein